MEGDEAASGYECLTYSVLVIVVLSKIAIYMFLTTKKSSTAKGTRCSKNAVSGGPARRVPPRPAASASKPEPARRSAAAPPPPAARKRSPTPEPADLPDLPDHLDHDLNDMNEANELEDSDVSAEECTAPTVSDGASVAGPESPPAAVAPAGPPPPPPPAELTPSMARRQRRKRMKQRAADVAAAPEPVPAPDEQKLDYPPEVVYQMMKPYTLPAEQLHMLGFPHSSSFHRGKAYIYKGLAGSPRPTRKVKLDAAAKEFVPRALASSDCDSGTHSSEPDESSAGSSGSEPDEHQVPDDVSEPDSVQSSGSESERAGSEPRLSLLRPHCVRCQQQFAVTLDGHYVERERCVFHWGKLKATRAGSSSFACCGARPGGRGCSTASCHVWSGLLPGLNGPLKGFVRSRRRRVPPADGNHGVYALDCEMCYTGQGLELARVSVVGLNGKKVYDALVKPDRPVVDHNTRFSGITARQLDRATKTLRAVQSDLMGFISADTILVGHGLENDLRALRLVHDTVVDTSVLFPHYLGLPYRRRLSHLTSSCLRWSIQQHRGHDSLEDARACMQLLLWRTRRDLRLD